jgi:hypothetical protein
VRQRVHHTRDVKDIQESQQGRPRLSAFVSIVEDLLNPLLATARRIELVLARSRASVRIRPNA